MTEGSELPARAAPHRHGAGGPRQGRAALIATIVAGVLLVGVALALHLTAAHPASRPAAVPIVDRGALPSTGAARIVAPPSDAGTSTTGTRHTLTAGSRLHYDRLGLDAPIVHVSVSHGVMGVPSDPHTLGWWNGGAAPGDASGSTVLVGHINYAGTTGAFAALPRARPGDHVSVDGARGSGSGSGRQYRVTAVRTYPKTQGIPAAAFARSGGARLVLITCGGPFDPATGNYEDNIVVYADPS